MELFLLEYVSFYIYIFEGVDVTNESEKNENTQSIQIIMDV